MSTLKGIELERSANASITCETGATEVTIRENMESHETGICSATVYAVDGRHRGALIGGAYGPNAREECQKLARALDLRVA